MGGKGTLKSSRTWVMSAALSQRAVSTICLFLGSSGSSRVMPTVVNWSLPGGEVESAYRTFERMDWVEGLPSLEAKTLPVGPH